MEREEGGQEQSTTRQTNKKKQKARKHRKRDYILDIYYSAQTDPFFFSLSLFLHNTFEQGSYIMFHAVTGVPFEFSQGAYDGITLWEQIDGGEQFTATRKYLTTVPIVL